MRKRIDNGTIAEKRMLSLAEVCTYIGIGQVQARRYMDEIGATRHFSKRVVFDKTIIDKALDRM